MNQKISTLLLGMQIFTSAIAQAPELEWKIEYTTKLETSIRSCIGSNCNITQIEFLKVCMYRDKASAGFFTRGDWKAVIDPEDRSLCQEVLFADTSAKTLYLEAPLIKSSGMFLAGQQYIHCTPYDGHGESNLCSPARLTYCMNSTVGTKPSGYNACLSEFFTPYEANPRYRILQPNIIGTAVRESKLATVINQYLADEAERFRNAAVAAYRSAFENAKTLDSIRSFEMEYAGKDPEGLIPQLAATKHKLQVDEYRQRFASMKELSEIQAFITDYTGNDPDNKLPEARRRLASERQRVGAIAKKAADEKSASEKAASLANLEKQIIWCQRQSISAQRAIDRENQIGRVSGYVNKLVLRQAGELIVSCDESIPNNFAEYKRLGGTKTLAQLK